MGEKLVAILAELLELYQALLRLSRQKREALVAGKPQSIEAITRQEELLILQVGKLESMREKVLAELAVAYNVPAQNLTLSQIRELADKTLGDKLTAIEAGFKAVTAELAPLNKLNAQLIEQALNFVNYNINILAQTQTGPTYAPKGNIPQPQPNRAIFDAKA